MPHGPWILLLRGARVRTQLVLCRRDVSKNGDRDAKSKRAPEHTRPTDTWSTGMAALAKRIIRARRLRGETHRSTLTGDWGPRARTPPRSWGRGRIGPPPHRGFRQIRMTAMTAATRRSGPMPSVRPGRPTTGTQKASHGNASSSRWKRHSSPQRGLERDTAHRSRFRHRPRGPGRRRLPAVPVRRRANEKPDSGFVFDTSTITTAPTSRERPWGRGRSGCAHRAPTHALWVRGPDESEASIQHARANERPHTAPQPAPETKAPLQSPFCDKRAGNAGGLAPHFRFGRPGP
ncbi:hypothetical protein ECC02_002442 [Trypanosoma cruzi]|uniref:Uncharacterized protein n=1 Tax=Trypanosoma cruzi TaxID=5693 RepID=A0A7J6YCW5_TRYCR|nr:hypothetical protein ECC02_002442 [Trypanosoma cruzi]